MNLQEKLALLDSALDHKKLLTFRFSADRKHDYDLINWFCKNGEIRIFKHSVGSFSVTLITRNLQLQLGYVYPGCMERNKNDAKDASHSSVGRNWQNEYVRRAWTKLKSFHYCTNNLLRTPEETVKLFRGKEEYMFSNSKETKISVIKNSKKVTDILNSLTPVKLD